jgi:hypothetical protein
MQVRFMKILVVLHWASPDTRLPMKERPAMPVFVNDDAYENRPIAGAVFLLGSTSVIRQSPGAAQG